MRIRTLGLVALVSILAMPLAARAQALPSPGIARDTAVAVDTAPVANYFELAHFDTSNRPEGIVVDVWWNAYMKTGETKTLVKNFGPVSYSGVGLLAIAADALARAKKLEAGGLPAGLAYAVGQRDAIYASLQAAGHIPE